MIILSACDEKYEPMVRPLVRSVLKNTQYDIHVDYLNPELEREFLKDYCANYRIRMFLEHADRGKSMLWLDADTIVRKDILKLEEWLEEHDTIAVHTPEMGTPGTMNHWLISTVGISKHPGGRDFLRAWSKEFQKIHEDWYPSIMTCQQAYVTALKGFKVKDITYDYSDKNMRDESPLWEAQGGRKSDLRWIAEQEKYS